MKIRPLTTVNLARISLLQRQYRSACLVALIATITFVVTGGSLFGSSLLNGVSNTENRLGADLMIVPVGAERDYEGALLQGKPGTFYLEKETVQELLHADGIAKASPQLYIATFDSSHCAFPVQVIGFDPKTDFVIAPWLEKEMSGGPGYGEIVVGYNVRAEVGDDLLLFGDEYRTVGRLGKTGMGFDNSVFLNLETAKKIVADYRTFDEAAVLPEDDGAVSVVVADVARGLDSDEFAKDLRERFRGKSITVIQPQAIISDLSKNLRLTIGIISILLAALWLLAVVVLAVVFAVTVNERKKEFGVYRALGATRQKLAGIVLAGIGHPRCDRGGARRRLAVPDRVSVQHADRKQPAIRVPAAGNGSHRRHSRGGFSGLCRNGACCFRVFRGKAWVSGRLQCDQGGRMMLLEMIELSKKYMRNGEPFFAVDHGELLLQSGDFVCITGRSGSGKSTFLNLAAGLIHPDEGQIALDGKDYGGLNDKALSALRRERIGYIPQGTGILYSLSVLDNVRLPMALGSGRRGGHSRADAPRDADVVRKARALLSRLEIAHLEKENPRHLSGGELRRVAIARSLIADPALIIADEPTGDLDLITTEIVMSLLAEINRQGTAVLLSTHEFENVCYGEQTFGHGQRQAAGSESSLRPPATQHYAKLTNRQREENQNVT